MTRTPLLCIMLALAVVSARACDTATTLCHIQDVRNLSLQSLDLSFNSIARLEDSTFLQLPTLRQLNLSGNHISSVGKWMGGLEKLQTLDLASNNISTIDDNVFVKFTDLRWMNLSRNQLTVLRQSWLTGLHSLDTIDLSFNDISELENGTFLSLKALKKLDLQENTMSILSQHWLGGLGNLQTLDLSSNNISVLENGTFSSLIALQRLNLSKNRLEVLSEQSFKMLEALQVLDLSSNAISVLENGTFLPLLALQRLNLSKNRLEVLSEQSFKMLGALQVLDLSSNAISVLENGTFLPLIALQRLNLSKNRLEVLSEQSFKMLGALQVLDLSSNAISVLKDGTFSPLTALQRLNLSSNRLEVLGEECFVGLGHLLRLDVSSNGVRGVSPGTFQPLAGLTELVLGGNPALGRLRQEQLMLALGGTGRRLLLVDAARAGLTHVPAALTRSVSTLLLAGNAVAAVRCGDLDSYPLLRRLDLADNRLADVEEDALGRLEALETLRLDGNLLLTVPRSLPASLQALNLQLNRITVVRAGDLQDLPRLKELSFRECGVVTIEKGAFGQLLTLEILDLSRNPIVTLSAATLSGPNRLRILRLSQLASIQGGGEGEMAFPARAPERLEVLELDASPVLARQLLADTAALVAFRQLRVLNLEAAGLTRLRSDLFHFLPHLSAVRLAGNPWQCVDADDVLWLAEWMRRQAEEVRTVLQSATCTDPPHLTSTPIINLHEADFDNNRYGNYTSTSTDSPSTSLPTPAPTSSNASNESNVVHTSTIIHIIPNDNSSNNSTQKDAPSKRLVQEITHLTDNRTYPDPILPDTEHKHRHLLNITVLHLKDTNKTINSSSHFNPVTTETTFTINQSTHPNNFTSTSYFTLTSTDSTTTVTPMQDISFGTTAASRKLGPAAKHENDTLPDKPALVGLSHANASQNSTQGNYTKSLHITGKIPPTNQSRGEQRSFDSIMRDEYTPNPKSADDKSTRINPFIDYIVPGKKLIKKESDNTFNKQVKSFNNVIQSVGSFINETKTKLTLTHEVREEKLPASVRKLVDSIALAEREEMQEGTTESGGERSLNSSGTARLEVSNSSIPVHPNTTDSWAGENLLFENVTAVASGGKSVFYSSRASDAFSSSERVTVQNASATTGVSGSHPGMFVLLAVGVGVAAALAMALSHCAKRRRRLAVEYSRQQDIEVRSMSSIGDLW